MSCFMELLLLFCVPLRQLHDKLLTLRACGHKDFRDTGIGGNLLVFAIRL